MKLVTFQGPNQGPDASPKAGALIDGGATVVDLQAAHQAQRGVASPMLASVLAMAEHSDRSVELAQQLLDAGPDVKSTRNLADVTLLAPIPAPPQMRDFLCFEEHLLVAFKNARALRAADTPDPEAAMREMEAQGMLTIPKVWYDRPIFYHPNRLNVVGTGCDIQWPQYSKRLDFELEFGCFIGKPGKDIRRDQARAHIFGYTIFNDVSARDEQVIDMPGQLGPGKGKDFDTGNVLGPCLVTADELKDPYSLDMEVRVNGERWGGGNSGLMRWRFEDCIAHASRSETLFSGEFFGSGTVGTGCGMEIMRFLTPGDVVELEVKGIGILRNRFVKQAG